MLYKTVVKRHMILKRQETISPNMLKNGLTSQKCNLKVWGGGGGLGLIHLIKSAFYLEILLVGSVTPNCPVQSDSGNSYIYDCFSGSKLNLNRIVILGM